jgi:hypothetical protein
MNRLWKKEWATLYDVKHVPRQKHMVESTTVFFHETFQKVNQIAHVSLSPEKTLCALMLKCRQRPMHQRQ